MNMSRPLSLLLPSDMFSLSLFLSSLLGSLCLAPSPTGSLLPKMLDRILAQQQQRRRVFLQFLGTAALLLLQIRQHQSTRTFSAPRLSRQFSQNKLLIRPTCNMIQKPPPIDGSTTDRRRTKPRIPAAQFALSDSSKATWFYRACALMHSTEIASWDGPKSRMIVSCADKAPCLTSRRTRCFETDIITLGDAESYST
jgi:hypothetical protein